VNNSAIFQDRKSAENMIDEDYRLQDDLEMSTLKHYLAMTSSLRRDYAYIPLMKFMMKSRKNLSFGFRKHLSAIYNTCWRSDV
jgi:hypothetical protein